MKTKNRIINGIFIIMLSLFFSGCDKVRTVKEPEEPNPTSQETPLEEEQSEVVSLEEEQSEVVSKPEDGSLAQKAEEELKRMTLEEKVAQLFIVTLESLTGKSPVTVAGDITKESLQSIPVGGIVYFSENLVNPEQIKKVSDNLQKYSQELTGIPMFIGIDEEGGLVSRIANHENFSVKKFANMREIGDTGDVDLAYEVGKTIGSYLPSFGVNLDFAPVADVLVNENNPDVKKRSFGTDEELVADMSAAYIQGMQEENVYSCMKHFPGNGSSAGNTHEDFTYTEGTLKELKKKELVPFQKGIEEGVSFIMVSHTSVPKVVGDYTPSSMSKTIITDILRKDMGYKGIVITDAMNMGAVAKHYSAEEAAVRAVDAGADIILMPENLSLAYQGILEAIKDGELTEKRIDQSVIRILKAKANARIGFWKQEP